MVESTYENMARCSQPHCKRVMKFSGGRERLSRESHSVIARIFRQGTFSDCIVRDLMH
jgi:hypothetical protein